MAELVEGTVLEKRHPDYIGIVGSNPTPTAKIEGGVVTKPSKARNSAKSGKKNLTLAAIQKLANALGVSADELLK